MTDVQKNTSRRKRRAGVIPFYFDNGVMKMLFMRPSNPTYGGAEFQIAKGVIEDGESPRNAAIREGMEELGLIEDNIKMGEVYPLGCWLHTIEIFAVHVVDPHRFNEFDHETAETRWMTLREYGSHGRTLQEPIIEHAVAKMTDLFDMVLSHKPATTQSDKGWGAIYGEGANG